MTTQILADDAMELSTYIPEFAVVGGLDYGGHVSMGAMGWSGYYVRPTGTGRWGIARMTPASDELLDTDDAIVAAIAEELKE